MRDRTLGSVRGLELEGRILPLYPLAIPAKSRVLDVKCGGLRAHLWIRDQGFGVFLTGGCERVGAMTFLFARAHHQSPTDETRDAVAYVREGIFCLSSQIPQFAGRKARLRFHLFHVISEQQCAVSLI